MAPRHQTEVSADVAGSPEASGIINCRCECESRELPDTGNAHQPAAASLAWRACLMNVELSARGSRTPNTTARPRVLESDPLPDQLLASDDQRADGMRRQGLHIN